LEESGVVCGEESEEREEREEREECWFEKAIEV
jgi:hypothetical protein